MGAKKRLLQRAETLMERLAVLLPGGTESPDWDAHAFRWRRRGDRGWLQAVPAPHRIDLGDLLCLDRQKAEIERNTVRSSPVAGPTTSFCGALAGPANPR